MTTMMDINRQIDELVANNTFGLEAIKKWDGKLPQTMPGMATPFVHIK